MDVYVDRSASMSGFLDSGFTPEFSPTSEDRSFRRLLTDLLATEIRPINVYGFGDRVGPVLPQANRDIVQQLMVGSFYRNTDTRLEDVLELVEQDSTRQRVHIIVTDGRRSRGEASVAQYQRVGQLARDWTSGGGVFVFSALRAPFRSGSRDRGECRPDTEKGSVCPLYLIAYGPSSWARRLLQRVELTSERLYVLPTTTDTVLPFSTEALPASTNLHSSGGFPSRSPLHLLFRAPQALDSLNLTVSVRIDERDTRFAADDSLRVTVWSAPLSTEATAESFQLVRDIAASWVRPEAPWVDERKAKLSLPIVIRSRPQLEPIRYRIDVSSTGRPAWFGEYEASEFGDRGKTFGLSVLTAQLNPRGSRLGSLFVTVY